MSKRLIKAAQNGDLQKVKQYFNEGDDIHYNNDIAFCWAVTYGHFEVVRFFT